jgi:hypothetical protein
VGRTLEVLWETAHLRENGLLWSGLTDNYLRVFAPGGATLRNVITPVYLTADTADGLRGEIVAAPLEGYSRSMLAPGATTSR